MNSRFWQQTLLTMAAAFALTSSNAREFNPAKLNYIANFSPKEGANPASEPIVASDGNYYGVLPNRSRNDLGSVYRLTPAGEMTVLHRFKGRDGARPMGRLVQGSDGAFYGTTHSGGREKNCGTVFRVTADGTFSTLHVFDCGKHGGNPSGGLIQAQDGFLYGMTESGGKGDDGTVYKVDLGGNFSIVSNFGSYVQHRGGDAGSGAMPTGELLQTPDGTFFGITTKGGGHEGGALFSMTTAGVLTHCHGFHEGEAPNGALTYVPQKDEVVGTYRVRAVFAYHDNQFRVIVGIPYGATLTGGLTLGPDGSTLYGYTGSSTGGLAYSVDSTDEVSTLARILKGNVAGRPAFAASGDLIGATTSGGSFGVGAVFDLRLP